MGLDKIMIIAGLGCRKGASAAQISAAIAAALSRAGYASEALGLIGAPAHKAEEPGIASAAGALGVPLVLVQQADLEAAGPRTITHSARVLASWGVPSMAEAVALAAGGAAAILVAPRIALGPVTCALAETEDVP